MNPIRLLRVVFLVGGLSLLGAAGGGCAHYEYDIVSPAEFRQHIGTKAWTEMPRPPVDYRFITYDNHLVMEIYNHQKDPVLLLGDRSDVVDPGGQSHPLRGQGIAPGSFIKLIFPPMPPTYRAGPSVGIGFGFFGSAYHNHGYYYGGVYDPLWDPWYDEPRYFTVYDPAGQVYWSWEGESDVRVDLAYETENGAGKGEPVAHSFVFHRRRM